MTEDHGAGRTPSRGSARHWSALLISSAVALTIFILFGHLVSYSLSACRKNNATEIDRQHDSITLVVDGMLKSRSGAT